MRPDMLREYLTFAALSNTYIVIDELLVLCLKNAEELLGGRICVNLGLDVNTSSLCVLSSESYLVKCTMEDYNLFFPVNRGDRGTYARILTGRSAGQSL